VKKVLILLVLALVLASGGTAFLAAAAYERDMAAVVEHLAVEEYDAASARLDDAAGYARYAKLIPYVGRKVDHDLAVHRAGLQYWQQQYDALLPRDADPVGAVEGEPADVQMFVANAAYRAGQARATTRDTSMQTLQEGISGYLTVLKGDTWDERAAYNFEFLARVRDDIAKGRRKTLPPMEKVDGSNGQAGSPFEPTNTKAFEIYIPLEDAERTRASEAGKSTPNARKG
jgi:hypothetical protein